MTNPVRWEGQGVKPVGGGAGLARTPRAGSAVQAAGLGCGRTTGLCRGPSLSGTWSPGGLRPSHTRVTLERVPFTTRPLDTPSRSPQAGRPAQAPAPPRVCSLSGRLCLGLPCPPPPDGYHLLERTQNSGQRHWFIVKDTAHRQPPGREPALHALPRHPVCSATVPAAAVCPGGCGRGRPTAPW